MNGDPLAALRTFTFRHLPLGGRPLQDGGCWPEFCSCA